jgi:hypothetical protein
MSLPTRSSLLAFLTAFVALAVQVLVHRMVSVKLVNNYAFLVISLCMLGFAVSGVVLSRWLAPLLARREETMAASAALFGLSLLMAAAVFYVVPPGPQWAASRVAFVAAFLKLVPLSLFFAVPFVFAGLILGLLLASPDLRSPLVYGFDLLGSAAGAVLVLPILAVVGVERAAFLTAMGFAAGAWLLCRPRMAAVRLLLLSNLVVLGAATSAPEWWLRMSYPEGSVLAATQVPGSGFVLESVQWDPVARIEFSRIPHPRPDTVAWPYLVGEDLPFLDRFERILTQNNTAYTYAVRYDGRPDSLAGIEQTMYMAAYEATSVKKPRVLVIGVGGGFDVLAAIRGDAGSITGVEVNGATLDLLTRREHEYFGPWASDPRVTLVHDDGRHYLAAHREPFDVLQLSGVDSVSGTPAAAHVFSENYLYTAEAMDLFIARLGPEGIINLMRTEYVPPKEMLRALVTAVFALRRAGVARPADHVALVASRDGLFVALLVKKSAFRPAEVDKLGSWAGSSPFMGLAAAPGHNGERRNVYQLFLSLDDPRLERAFVAGYPFDVRPATDDRPFFFRFSFWRHLWSRVPAEAASVPVLELGLVLLLAIASVAALFCLFLPLRLLAGAGLRVPGASRFAAYFGGLGLGYLGIEMALIQKFGLLLGHPNYALSVVLAGLLLATGLGSLLSEWLLEAFGRLRFVGYALAMLVLLEGWLVFPQLGPVAAWSLAARVSVVLVLIGPVGLLLGVFFPAGLAGLKATAPAFVPWAWGVNGIFSVLAPILGVAVSVTLGGEMLLLAAVPVYLGAGLLAPTGRAEAPTG